MNKFSSYMRNRERGAVLSRRKPVVTKLSKYIALGLSLLLIIVGVTVPGRARADVQTVKYGMSGAAVKSVQRYLVTLGYLEKADGIFGTQTLNAIKKFQKDNKLEVDGMAGVKTQSKLLTLATPKMEVGSTGESVTAIQNALNQAGYSVGQADGEFGNLTKAAVIRFQKDHNLSADGIVGQKTLLALYGITSTPKLSTANTLRLGQRGDSVKALQTVLKTKGYLKGTIDGVFGALTEQAVKNFQKAYGLTADGVAGKKTLSALNGDVYVSDAALSKGEQVLAIAKAQIGIPYVWAGSSPSTGFDCSGLIYYCYKQMGVTLPRGGGGQMKAGKSISSLSKAIPGDILCWSGHVGMYAGGNLFVHAPQTGELVKIAEIRKTPVDIRRIFN